MKIAVLSGKGGTGKSTVTAELSRIVGNKMLADCDVDAPNLHLMMSGQTIENADYYSVSCVNIDQNKCTAYGRCHDVCRFDAIDQNLHIDSLSCEGCGTCAIVCPQGAICSVSKIAHCSFALCAANLIPHLGHELSRAFCTGIKQCM